MLLRVGLGRINGISFSVDDPTAYHDEAREKAIKDAKAKAEQIAKLAGVKLGSPTYISESLYTPGPIYREAVFKTMEAPAPAAAPPPISAGEMDISLTVQIAYNIR